MRYDAIRCHEFKHGVFLVDEFVRPRICGEWVMFTDIYAPLFSYETTIIGTITGIVSSVTAGNSQKFFRRLISDLNPRPFYYTRRHSWHVKRALVQARTGRSDLVDQ